MLFKHLLISSALIFATNLVAIELGQTPPRVILEGALGGNVSGEKWDSTSIKNKAYLVMYVDPDEKEFNAHVEEALDLYFKDYSYDSRGSIAIINMGATWSPNFILEPILEYKQERFPNTLFVKDLNKTLVKQWGLKDDGYQVMLFSKKGKLVYSNSNKLSHTEIEELISLLDYEINN